MHADHLYIEALRRNDEAGIRDIYRQYSGQALRWIVQRGGTPDDARDVFQDTLMAVFEKAQQSGFVLTCPLGALLHVIWSRKWVDRLRQKNRDTEVRNAEERRYDLEVSEDALSIAEESLAEQSRQERLARSFEQLSELCRQLLGLLSGGTPPREVALQLQMNSVDTLYRRKNACVERWRGLIKVDMKHQPSSTPINPHQPLSTLINLINPYQPHQPSSTLINTYQPES